MAKKRIPVFAQVIAIQLLYSLASSQVDRIPDEFEIQKTIVQIVLDSVQYYIKRRIKEERK